MNLYFKADDGSYHKLSEITELEASIMDADDKLFDNPEENNSVRKLKEHGYFEQELSFEIEGISKEFMDELNAWIDELIKRHYEYEVAKRTCRWKFRFILRT